MSDEATNPKPSGRSSRAGLIIGVVAALVLLVLIVATRPGSPPVVVEQPAEKMVTQQEPQAGAGPVSTQQKPAETDAGKDATPNASAPAAAGPAVSGSGTSPVDPKDMPSDHPPLQVDEGTLVSIQWFGHSCFYIHSPGGVCVVTDPFDPQATGLPAPNTGAHLITVSSDRPQHNYTAAVHAFRDEAGNRQSLRVLRGEGFSQGDVRVQSVSTGGGHSAYLIESGPLRILHLGNLRAPLSAAQIQRFGDVHVLMLPVGSGGLTPKQLVSLCQAIKPRIIFPMAYATPRMLEDGVKLQSLDAFVAASPYAVTEHKNDVVLLAPSQLPASTEIHTLAYRR